MRSNSVVSGRVRSPRRHWPVPHDSAAVCRTYLVLAAREHIASGSALFRAKTLISPASQVGRQRAMAGLSTMTHATMNAPHATYILIPPPVPSPEGKVVTRKWGKYDKFVSCARRCGGIGVRAASFLIRESLFAEESRSQRSKAALNEVGLSVQSRCRHIRRRYDDQRWRWGDDAGAFCSSRIFFTAVSISRHVSHST
jgi:hypothetical protein